MDNLTKILHQNNIDTSTFTQVEEVNDFVLRTFAVHGNDAIDFWFRLRDIRQQTNHWPVVLGNDEDLRCLRDQAQRHTSRSIRDTITQGLQMSPKLVFDEDRFKASEGLQRFMEDYRHLIKDHKVSAEDILLKQAHRLWQQITSAGVQTAPGTPDSVAPYLFQIPRDYKTDEGYPRVYVGLVPTLNSWEVPAYLDVGGWNSCPQPAEHVCILKYWHDIYGIEIVGISHDTIETLCACLPARQEDAEALAFEQYRYCSDIVDQGVGSIHELALGLKSSELWWFWWD